MDKVAGAVILYNPERDILSNINSYIDALAKLYVIDNSESPNHDLINAIKLKSSKINYATDGINKGIAERLNNACSLALDAGYDWLLTMDQDSSFSKGVIEKYFECASQYSLKDKVAMFGISYYGEMNFEDICATEETRRLITSGSLLNLKLFSKVGGFEDKLFIDEVDFEYCLRASSVGFATIKFKNILLNHSLGNISYHRSLKNTKITPRTLHSPLRVYYMVRNFLFINAKYQKQFPEDFRINKKALLNRLKNNLLYNKQRSQVVRFIIKAYLDFRRNKMGKYDANA